MPASDVIGEVLAGNLTTEKPLTRKGTITTDKSMKTGSSGQGMEYGQLDRLESVKSRSGLRVPINQIE